MMLERDRMLLLAAKEGQPISVERKQIPGMIATGLWFDAGYRTLTLRGAGLTKAGLRAREKALAEGE